MQNQAITLGNELRRFRTRRGISQFDLAVCMEWKGTNPVVQIEKDRRIPRADTLTRLGKCLDLNYLEMHYINGLAGYIPPTRLPPQDYVVDTLDHIATLIQDFPYPAYVVDYQFRLWAANPATALFTGGDTGRLREMMSGPLSGLDMVFDSRLHLSGGLAYLDAVRREQVFRFKASNAFRQHEPFFITQPERMASLAPGDYTAFMDAWREIDMNTMTNVRVMYIKDFYTRIEHGDMRFTFPEGAVSFYMRVESVLHLGDLLQIVTYVPVASASLPGNRELAEKISKRYAPDDSAPIKLWELMDIGPLFV